MSFSSAIITVCSLLFYFWSYQVLRQKLVRQSLEPWVRQRRTISFSEEDVVHISARLVSVVNGVLGTIFSLIVMWQAREDLLLGRSSMLIPFMHWIASYMIYDYYAMYECAYYRYQRHPHKRFAVFVRTKWTVILHHTLLLVFGYPLVVYPTWRRNKGDLIIGTFFLRELWNPYQNMAQILCRDTYFYRFIKVAQVPIQLVVRLLNWPLVITWYTAQYYELNFGDSYNSLHTVCIISILIWELLEIFWFWFTIERECTRYIRKFKRW